MAGSVNTLKQKAIRLEVLSSSEDDSDDELIFFERIHLPKIENFVAVTKKFSHRQFKNYFRLEKETVNALINMFEQSQFVPRYYAGRPAIIAEVHILSILWFAGNKTTLQNVGQRFNITQSLMFRIMDRVMDFLMDVGPKIIKMPTSNDEKRLSGSCFERISGFSGILGCIDRTSINIRTPASKIKFTYTNRHDLPSVTLQAICNHKRKFIDIFTGIPGKAHDARVLKMSDVNAQLPGICSDEAGKTVYHILGDGAYPIRLWNSI